MFPLKTNLHLLNTYLPLYKKGFLLFPQCNPLWVCPCSTLRHVLLPLSIFLFSKYILSAQLLVGICSWIFPCNKTKDPSFGLSIWDPSAWENLHICVPVHVHIHTHTFATHTHVHTNNKHRHKHKLERSVYFITIFKKKLSYVKKCVINKLSI